MTLTGRERWIPYLFLAPVFVLLVIFRLLPAVFGMRESLYSSFLGVERFVGLDNFAFIFSDPIFWESVRITLIFSVIINPLQTALALALALVANQALRGASFLRSVWLLPVAVSINVTVLIWGLMLDTDGGLINGILSHLAVDPIPWLTSPTTALSSIMLLISWKGVFFWMIFFLAALQAIPKAIEDAAAIDGASTWQTIIRVKVPMLRNVILFVLVADTVINFLQFAPPLILTQGGPLNSTNLLMHEVYRRGFLFGDLGSSSAMTMVLLGIVLTVVAVEFALFRRGR
jgi:multiple sugar transport system permease protein